MVNIEQLVNDFQASSFFNHPELANESQYIKLLFFIYYRFTGKISNMPTRRISELEILPDFVLQNYLTANLTQDQATGSDVFIGNYIVRIANRSSKNLLSIFLSYFSFREPYQLCDAEKYLISLPEFMYVLINGGDFVDEYQRLLTVCGLIDPVNIPMDDINNEEYRNMAYRQLMAKPDTHFASIEEDTEKPFDNIIQDLMIHYPNDWKDRFNLMLKWYHQDPSVRYSTNLNELKLSLSTFDWLGIDEKVNEILIICYIYNFPDVSVYNISHDLLIINYETDMSERLWFLFKVFVVGGVDNLLSLMLNHEFISESLRHYKHNIGESFEDETGRESLTFVSDLISRNRFEDAVKLNTLYDPNYRNHFCVEILYNYIDRYYTFSPDENLDIVLQPFLFIFSNLESFNIYEVVSYLFIECSHRVIEAIINFIRDNIGIQVDFKRLDHKVIAYSINSRDPTLFNWIIGFYKGSSFITKKWVIKSIGDSLVEFYERRRWSKFSIQLAYKVFDFVCNSMPFNMEIYNKVSNNISRDWPPAQRFFNVYSIYDSVSNGDPDSYAYDPESYMG